MILFIILLQFFLIAVALIVVSVVVRRRMTMGCTVPVEAVVERYSSHHDYARGGKNRTSIYGFDYGGVHYTVPARTRIQNGNIGSRHTLFIDPNQPQNHYRKVDLRFPLLLRLTGIYVFCIAAFFAVQILFS